MTDFSAVVAQLSSANEDQAQREVAWQHALGRF